MSMLNKKSQTYHWGTTLALGLLVGVISSVAQAGIGKFQFDVNHREPSVYLSSSVKSTGKPDGARCSNSNECESEHCCSTTNGLSYCFENACSS